MTVFIPRDCQITYCFLTGPHFIYNCTLTGEVSFYFCFCSVKTRLLKTLRAVCHCDRLSANEVDLCVFSSPGYSWNWKHHNLMPWKRDVAEMTRSIWPYVPLYWRHLQFDLVRARSIQTGCLNGVPLPLKKLTFLKYVTVIPVISFAVIYGYNKYQTHPICDSLIMVKICKLCFVFLCLFFYLFEQLHTSFLNSESTHKKKSKQLEIWFDLIIKVVQRVFCSLDKESFIILILLSRLWNDQISTASGFQANACIHRELKAHI